MKIMLIAIFIAITLNAKGYAETVAPGGVFMEKYANSSEIKLLKEESMRQITERIRNRFQTWLNNSQRYIIMAKEVFSEHGLPEELAYLPLIESGFGPWAISPVGAKGLWQLMPETARRYGLRVDEYVDERRDPYFSTITAAKYLNDLYDLFDSWALALAAYNAGEGRIARIGFRVRLQRPIRIAAKVDASGIDAETAVQNLYRSRYTPHETRRYVPLFLAALTIARDPEKFGFDIKKPSRVYNPEGFKTVVRSDTTLQEIARRKGVRVSRLRTLNPALLTDVVPRGFRLRY